MDPTTTLKEKVEAMNKIFLETFDALEDVKTITTIETGSRTLSFPIEKVYKREIIKYSGGSTSAVREDYVNQLPRRYRKLRD